MRINKNNKWSLCKVITLSSAIFLSVTSLSKVQAQGNETYKFGVSDQLQIRVFDLRPATGEAYQWPAFNAEYTIDPAGKLSLPLIGVIDAAGITSIELQNRISQKLQSKVGLAQQPSTTVQVLKYRPFYIVGSIQNPGEYEYRPGLTMIQSLGIGGGLEKSSGPDKFTFEKNALTTIGELRRQRVELASLLIKSSRLEAEINDYADLKIDTSQITDINTKDILNLVDEERSLLKTHRKSNSLQLNNINSTIETLKEQIKSLDNKDLTQQRQIEISKQDLSQLNELLNKGLISTTRRISAEQVVAGMENNKLDIFISKLKSQQDLKNAQKEIIDIIEKQRVEAIRLNSETKTKIIDLKEKVELSNKLISQINNNINLTSYSNVIFRVQRMIEGRIRVSQLADGDAVMPGDVIIVESLAPLQH